MPISDVGHQRLPFAISHALKRAITQLTEGVDEEFRQRIETLITLSARCDDAAVRSSCDSLRRKGVEALCSGDYLTLDSGARDFFAQHEKLMDLIALTLRQFSPGFKRAS